MTNPNDLDDFLGEIEADEDDILDAYDEDELTEAERERREERFQKEVQRRTRILMSPKKFSREERLEAAQWLGESGEPAAIKPLVMVYEKDKTPGMKETAAYALGQFRALGEALNDPEMEDTAFANIEKIVIHGEFGSRARTRPFRILQAILTVSLLVFLGGGALLAISQGDPGGAAVPTLIAGAADTTDEPLATATPDTPERAAEALQAQYNLVESDRRLIQEQVDFAKTNGSQSCDAVGGFNQATAFTLSPAGQADETLPLVADSLETVRSGVNDIIATYEAACAASSAINSEAAFELDTRLFDLEVPLMTVVPGLNAALGLELTVAPTEEAPPTTAAEPTAPPAEETAEVTPTEGPDTDAAEFALSGILDEMIGINGTVMIMNTYWTQAAGGSDINCLQPQPIVPENYELALDLIGISPDLDSAVQNINGGLDLIRTAVTRFYAACDSGSLQQDAATQLTVVQTAQSLFELAQTSLDALRRAGN